MAIKFWNLRTKEIRVAETEPMIAALYNSSDRGPNALTGQDFKWRLAPEVVVQMKRIANNAKMLEKVAVTYNLPMDEIDEKAILQFISDQTPNTDDAPVAQEGDYEDEYLDQIRKLEGSTKKKQDIEEVTEHE